MLILRKSYKKLMFFTLTIVLLISSSPGYSKVTKDLTFKYDGFICDENAIPLNKTVKLRFNIFNNNGKKLWERDRFVTVKDGKYTAILGLKNKLQKSYFDGNHYLAIELLNKQVAKKISLSQKLPEFNTHLNENYFNKTNNRIKSDTTVKSMQLKNESMTNSSSKISINSKTPNKYGILTWDPNEVSRSIFDNGRVGIGTRAPNHFFHVKTGDAVGLFESTGTQAYLRLSTSEGINRRVEFTNRPGGRASIWVSEAGDAFNVLRNGNIGIGLINPTKKLELLGNSTFKGGPFFFQGKVGIGVENPKMMFEVQGDSIFKGGIAKFDGVRNWFTDSEKKGRLRVGAAWGIPGLYSEDTQDLVIGVHSSKKAYIGSNGSFMTVQGNGCVGIKTNNPSVSLEVVGPTIFRNGVSNFKSGTIFEGNRNWFSDNEKKGRVRVGAAWGIPGFYSEDTQDIVLGVHGSRKVFIGTRGAFLTVQGNGNVGIGTQDPGKYRLYVAGNAYSTGTWSGSDIRWKKDIKPLTNSLEKISRLNGVSYNWKTNEFPEMNFSEKEQIGLISQDVEKVIPELVSTSSDGYKSISYEKISAILIEAVKELKEQNKLLQKKVDNLEKVIRQNNDVL